MARDSDHGYSSKRETVVLNRFLPAKRQVTIRIYAGLSSSGRAMGNMVLYILTFSRLPSSVGFCVASYVSRVRFSTVLQVCFCCKLIVYLQQINN